MYLKGTSCTLLDIGPSESTTRSALFATMIFRVFTVSFKILSFQSEEKTETFMWSAQVSNLLAHEQALGFSPGPKRPYHGSPSLLSREASTTQSTMSASSAAAQARRMPSRSITSSVCVRIPAVSLTTTDILNHRNATQRQHPTTHGLCAAFFHWIRQSRTCNVQA
mmetsp:Transcript_8229/g.36692  ORF Transcript_8229/g.36692 Transcript_8229/m.36692 type:complete len:166 (+) Transcript_8229:4711-5208(+)